MDQTLESSSFTNDLLLPYFSWFADYGCLRWILHSLPGRIRNRVTLEIVLRAIFSYPKNASNATIPRTRAIPEDMQRTKDHQAPLFLEVTNRMCWWQWLYLMFDLSQRNRVEFSLISSRIFLHQNNLKPFPSGNSSVRITWNLHWQHLKST